MKVLVTGATGFLGSHVAEQLSSAGASVRCLVRKTSDVSLIGHLPGVELAYGAVEDAPSVAAAMEGIDAVIDSAGLVKALGTAPFQHINVEGTRNMLAAAERVAPKLKRFVHVSSLAAVGPSDDGSPVDPTMRNPVTHYGRSKAAAEDVVREAASRLPVTILRPPWIYGPRDRETLSIFQSVKRGVLPYLGTGQATYSIIYAEDAARACVRAIDAAVPSGSAFFLEDGKTYALLAMLEEIEHALGKRAFVRFGLPFFVMRVVATASELASRVRRQPVMLTRDKLHELAAPHWVCDASDTRAALDWRPEVEWSEGARRTLEWYRAEGWL